MNFKLYQGDCLEAMKKLPKECIDALIADPPSGTGFLGLDWDTDKGGRAAWVSWFSGVMQECLRLAKPGSYALVWALPRTSHWTATGLEDAGWIIQDIVTHHFGTGFPKSRSSLKPASEHWILAYKKGSKHLQVEECRIPVVGRSTTRHNTASIGYTGSKRESYTTGSERESYTTGSENGRYPANVVLTCQCDLEEHSITCPVYRIEQDKAGASSFFYVAKASKKERTLDGQIENDHPTVKSLELMRYLVRLITPKNGIVLDPFLGSGTTGEAALREGCRFVGIEQEEEWYNLSTKRLELVVKGSPQ